MPETIHREEDLKKITKQFLETGCGVHAMIATYRGYVLKARLRVELDMSEMSLYIDVYKGNKRVYLEGNFGAHHMENMGHCVFYPLRTTHPEPNLKKCTPGQLGPLLNWLDWLIEHPNS